MSRLYVARRRYRRGVLLEPSRNMSLLFPLDGVDRSELDELIRGILAKGGVTDEAEVQAVVEAAEKSSEARVLIAEQRAEIRRLMALRAQGLKLMQVGFRKWKEVWYPAVHRRMD